MKNILIAVLLLLCSVLAYLVVSKQQDSEKPASPLIEQAFLDNIIAQEIDSKNKELKNADVLLLRIHMTTEATSHANACVSLLKEEIEFLTSLKSHANVLAKHAYCKMILAKRTSIMSHEIKFKNSFGCETFPKEEAYVLLDNDISFTRKRYAEAVETMKKVDSMFLPEKQ